MTVVVIVVNEHRPVRSCSGSGYVHSMHVPVRPRSTLRSATAYTHRYHRTSVPCSVRARVAGLTLRSDYAMLGEWTCSLILCFFSYSVRSTILVCFSVRFFSYPHSFLSLSCILFSHSPCSLTSPHSSRP